MFEIKCFFRLNVVNFLMNEILEVPFLILGYYVIFLRDFSDYLVSRIQYVSVLYEISFNVAQ